MKKNKSHTPRLTANIEERLRPSKFLGYDHDKLGYFLLKKEVFDIAEEEFKRAIYLNPYEPVFSQHLAWAYFKQKRFKEARDIIATSLETKPDDKDSQYILQRIESEERKA
jgi:predicted Zn-dependent protease